MYETQVTVVGYAITEPVEREIAGGHRLVSFRVVATSRRFDQASGQWTDGDRFLTTVNCWKRLADGVAGGLAKGDPVVVTGRLRTREYESGGQRRTVVEMDATAVGIDLARASPPAHGEVRALAPAGVAPPGG